MSTVRPVAGAILDEAQAGRKAETLGVGLGAAGVDGLHPAGDRKLSWLGIVSGSVNSPDRAGGFSVDRGSGAAIPDCSDWRTSLWCAGYYNAEFALPDKKKASRHALLREIHSK